MMTLPDANASYLAGSTKRISQLWSLDRLQLHFR